MPGAAYQAWWAYFVAYSQQAEAQKAQAEHDQTMDTVSRALKPM